MTLKRTSCTASESTRPDLGELPAPASKYKTRRNYFLKKEI